MFEVGFSEMLLIALVALLVLGPNKLPKLSRDVGRWAGRARQMVRQMQDQLDHETRVAEWSLGDPERAKTLNNPPAIADVSAVPDGPDLPRRPVAAVPTGPEAVPTGPEAVPVGPEAAAVQHPAMAALNVPAGPGAVTPPLAPDSLPTSTVNEHDRPLV
jgi:sec-independent protein translocase protein TatB